MNFELQNCYFEKGCTSEALSCRYLSHLNPTIIKEFYPNPEAAVEAVRVGHAWGAMYFTDNFTDALVARMALGKIIILHEITIETNKMNAYYVTIQDEKRMMKHWINRKFAFGWTCRINKLVYCLIVTFSLHIKILLKVCCAIVNIIQN